MSLKNFQSCPQQIIAATRHFNGSHVYEEESFESSKSINIKKHDVFKYKVVLEH